jgi:hypothetical protein
MKKLAPGALAGLAAAALLAAPAFAAPGQVGVRIEGDAQTLVPRTVVTTTAEPVGKPGQPTCSGTSALGALDKATGGDWQSTYDADFQTYNSTATIKGETHDNATSSYWAIWLNDTYASLGLCGLEVQAGDELLFVPECWAASCSPTSPLRLTGVPATAAPGATVTVKVDALTPPLWPETETKSAPAAGATVTYGGATATTGADGTAQFALSGAGPVSVQATKAGHMRSATASTCVTTGNDGKCGSAVTPGGGPGGGGGPVPDDETAPVATLSGLKDGAKFSRRRAPRELRGTVSADPSGIKSVRLSIMRKRKGRCWAFDGGAERFKRHRCGGSKSFRIGDRAEWSYLLPKRLPRGRYTIRVAAIDRAGNDSATVTKVRVR